MATTIKLGDHQSAAPAGKPRFLWLRFAAVAALLGFIGWRFYYYCYPAPTEFQMVAFYFTLFVILLETIQAGLYRSYSPWERHLVTVVRWMVIAVLVLVSGFVILYLVNLTLLADNYYSRDPDPLVFFFRFIVTAVLIIAIIWGLLKLIIFLLQEEEE